jgi:hypothetical protein
VAFDPDPADFATRQALLTARPPGEPLWVSLRAALLEYVAGRGERIDIHKRLTAGSASLTESDRDTLDQIHDELLEWATARSPDPSALETALPVNVALAAILTAFDAWQVDEGMARLAGLASVPTTRSGQPVLGTVIRNKLMKRLKGEGHWLSVRPSSCGSSLIVRPVKKLHYHLSVNAGVTRRIASETLQYPHK